MRLLKEPLIHFILLGAALFAVYAGLNRPDSKEGIVVTASMVQALEAQFSNDWNRAPSAEERQGLIRDYVREELAVREALALGLDRNDPVVRQRLRQKIELMVEEDAVVRAPTDGELENYLQANADLFRDENGALPKLEEIHSLVVFEWENQQRLEQLDGFYSELETRYGVQVEL
ncbi:hypothetical protein [Pontiella sp.]|uniref:hypothetical protein n=1 Tax=Pontiella sp. TaxID=2837462 RepID=UPI003569F626